MMLDQIFDELGERLIAACERADRAAYARGLFHAGRLLEQVRHMSASEMRLQGGEMTAAEIRTLRSWLGVIADAVRERAAEARGPDQKTEEA